MAVYNTHLSEHDGEVAGAFRKFWAVGTQKWLGDGEVRHDQKWLGDGEVGHDQK